MAYVRYIKNNNYHKYYQYAYAATDEMSVIGMFLARDVAQFNAECYREWALDDSSNQYGGNVTTLEKEDGFIIVSDTYSQDDDGGPYVKILPREFVNLLDQWQRVFERQPKEIIITEIDGVYAVEGIN